MAWLLSVHARGGGRVALCARCCLYVSLSRVWPSAHRYYPATREYRNQCHCRLCAPQGVRRAASPRGGKTRRRGHRPPHTSRMAETDFIRFVGRKSEDEQSKIAHVLVGEGDLRLRADASLLAVSNRFGALFCCTAQGLRWCWLADLHQQCTPNGAAAVFTSVTSVTGSPFVLALSSDNMQLALLTAGEKTALLHLFDVAEILRGRSDPLDMFPARPPSSRPARVPAFDRHECTKHELGLEGSVIDLQVSCCDSLCLHHMLPIVHP